MVSRERERERGRERIVGTVIGTFSSLSQDHQSFESTHSVNTYTSIIFMILGIKTIINHTILTRLSFNTTVPIVLLYITLRPKLELDTMTKGRETWRKVDERSCSTT